jgi:hypothetical protein
VPWQDDDATPTDRPAQRPPTWPEVAIAVCRIVTGNAAVVTLALAGLVPGEAALAALGFGIVPGVVRLLKPNRSPAIPPPT